MASVARPALPPGLHRAAVRVERRAAPARPTGSRPGRNGISSVPSLAPTGTNAGGERDKVRSAAGMIEGQIIATAAIAFVATAGVIAHPLRLPEAVWAVSGALLLVLAGLIPAGAALQAVGRGTDVYLFLAGMMLLSEVARRERLFDWIAAHTVARANRSGRRLFALIYAIGVVVTAFLSNDATAVVLTPAVLASARAAGAEPLPYLFACALIANAASFVLPISNPANLVLYASHVPSLLEWLGHFALASACSVAATFVVLRLLFRADLAQLIGADVETPALSAGGIAAAIGIGATAISLLVASAAGIELGLPTAICGALTAVLATVRSRMSPLPLLRGVSWSVLPLVAGLFVLVEGLSRTGAVAAIGRGLAAGAASSERLTAIVSGAVLALACNLMNNLPAGLVAGSAAHGTSLPTRVVDGLLVGVDLGPNLSITGSLATILWLVALRREGIEVSFGRFLRVGLLAMPPALALALLAGAFD